LFQCHTDEDSAFGDDEKRSTSIRDDHNENDGYITDDEQPEQDDAHSVRGRKRKRRQMSRERMRRRNIPVITFMGPNSTGKSTLLNVIAGDNVFVTMDELTDYDSMSQAVRCKIVNRADREFILLDVDGLFPDRQCTAVEDSALKLFCCVYAVSSVIVWNDVDEHSALLRRLLQRADAAMSELNGDGNDVFGAGGHIADSARLADSFLPEPFREVLLKKYRRLMWAKESKQSGHSNEQSTHKPAFIFLRRDYERPRLKHMAAGHGDRRHLSSPWLSSGTDAESTNSKFVRDAVPPMALNGSPLRSRPSPKYNLLTSNSSPSLISLSGSNFNGDSSPSPRVRTALSLNGQNGPNGLNASNGINGNDSVALSIVDEMKECASGQTASPQAVTAQIADQGAYWSDSSALTEPVLNSGVILKRSVSLSTLGVTTRESSGHLFSQYVQRHPDFAWLNQLALFSSVDGVVLRKLHDDSSEDEDSKYTDPVSLVSVLKRVDCWIRDWCKRTENVVPIVRNHGEMTNIVDLVNLHNGLSAVRIVEQLMKTKGSRLPRYFYFDEQRRTVDGLKQLAERFQWDQQNLTRWFTKHFNRLWYATRSYPNAHHALLYHALFYESFWSQQELPMIPTIMRNLSHFFFQIAYNKVDLYQGIVEKSSNWGSFCGAISGLSSLSLMTMVHPIVGIAAVPLSIRLGSNSGNKIGTKIGDAIAYSKSRYIDGTQYSRYGFGDVEDPTLDRNRDEETQTKTSGGPQ